MEKKDANYRELENKTEIIVTKYKADLKEVNDKFNNFLIQANNDAQRMKDSLYIANMRTKNIQQQIKNSAK